MEACLRIFCLFNLRHLSSSSAYQPENINHHKTAARRGSSSSELQLAASAAAVRLSMEGSSSALHEMPLASVPESENSQASVKSSTIQDASDHVLPEWELLSESVKQELQKMLFFKTVSTYDYPFIFRLDELTQGHSLLFMSWAIVASPYSQPILNNSNSSSLNLLTKLNLSPTKFCNFVRAVEQGYRENPYHNRIHAADVLQVLHTFLLASTVQLTTVEHFSILMAAIAHDVGHDGTNNLLHIQKQSPLAVQFENVSVLEQHHVQVGLQELETSGLLQELPWDQQAEIRQRITDAILQTDMAKHQALIEAYQQGDLDPWQQAMYLLHLSDISNPGRSTSSKWGELVFDEFFQIGDEQRLLGLPISFDRTTTDRVSTGQGFLKHFVLPAFEVVKFSNPKIMQGLYTNLEAFVKESEEEDSSNLSDVFQCNDKQ